ncbi:unnamed protein product [Urochloa humidicola]
MRGQTWPRLSGPGGMTHGKAVADSGLPVDRASACPRSVYFAEAMRPGSVEAARAREAEAPRDRPVAELFIMAVASPRAVARPRLPPRLLPLPVPTNTSPPTQPAVRITTRPRGPDGGVSPDLARASLGHR